MPCRDPKPRRGSRRPDTALARTCPSRSTILRSGRESCQRRRVTPVWPCPATSPADKITQIGQCQGRVSGVGALKVLVIGKGGREHALCWKLKQSPRVQAVFCAPGNAGTHVDAQNVAIEVNDTRGLIESAKREGIALPVAGPEEPLTLGIADAFQREGLRI